MRAISFFLTGEHFLFICLEGREVGLRQLICDEEGAHVLGVCVCTAVCSYVWATVNACMASQSKRVLV